MIRRSHVEIADFTEGDSDSDDSIKYFCKHCESYGFKVKLTNRMYPNNEPIPQDSDAWRQCMECGTIVAVYELEKEAAIENLVETVENPFDVAKNSFLGIDSRTSIGGKDARKKKQRQKELEDIKDDEVRRELAKGNTLISYFEHIPQ